MQAVLQDYCKACRTTLPQTAMDPLTRATPLVTGLAGTPASVTLPGSCRRCSVGGGGSHSPSMRDRDIP